MKIRMLLAVGAVLVLTIGGTSQTAAGGNSDGAKRCQKDGWQTLVRANGSSFANQGDCVTYAAKGGVPKQPQSISITTHAPAAAVYNTSFSVAATASAGPVTYSSSGACTNVGAVFTMTSGTGVCTVGYDQAGDANYNPAPHVTESVNAQKADQSITITTHAPTSAAFNASFTVAATAAAGPVAYSSSGPCTGIGGTFTITGEKGTCTVEYDQAGDSNYNAAPQVTESVLVAAAHAATTLAAAASAGDTNIKVTSTAPFLVTSLAAASSPGDSNIKVQSTDGLAVGQTLNVDLGGSAESRVIESVGTAGAGGTGVTLTAPLASAHASGSSVTPAGQVIRIDVGTAEEDATIQSVGTAGALGSGLTLTAPLANAHESGSPVEVAT